MSDKPVGPPNRVFHYGYWLGEREVFAGEDRRPRSILPYLLIILVCNLADWALTVDAVHGGWATELNPLGRLMLDTGTLGSLLWKMGMVLVGVVLLFVMRKRLWARVLTWGIAWTYMLLIAWHVFGRVAYFG